mmetsp:Transcript_74343/g.168399  ORF Transcript_74343/g.168399 Transcript_74343/m.168399 type:complete len:164 (+) Transcript_74343:119-610(+)
MATAAARPVCVYYWLPGDNDEADHPNAFEVLPQGGGGVRLKDIRARFPLPGVYHFRFQMRWESGFVWMDVTNDESTVPVSEDKVFAKVLRMNWGNSAGSVQPSPAAAQPRAAAAAAPPAPLPPEDMLQFGESPAPRAPPAAVAGSPAASPARGPTNDFDMLFS